MTIHRGVYVALLTPRFSSGTIDFAAFEKQMSFCAGCSIQGFAINGATGEFPSITESELERLLESASEFRNERQILCCVGSSSLQDTLRRGNLAQAARVDAILLPMPYFFPYRQDDLIAFCSSVAESVETPILLYNLPQFTTGLEPESVVELMRRHSNIVGVKDSSGSLDIVRAMTDRLPRRKRLIGNDSALCDAMRADVCDGVISGVACALPELMTSFFEHPVESSEFAQAEVRLHEFIEKISHLPTPWGLKAASAAREITPGGYPLPLSPSRKHELESLRAWFIEWLPAVTDETQVRTSGPLEEKVVTP